MGIGATELTLAQLAAYKYHNVNFVNVPGGDLIYTVAGHPKTVIINLGELLNIASGEVQGDAIAIDELEASQIADDAITGSELAETPSLFQTATEVVHNHDTGTGAVILAANNPGEGDRLVLCQVEVTEAFVCTSYEVDVGSAADPNGLFDDMFVGLATLAINETLVGSYLLPEGEALTLTETAAFVGDTFGQWTFRLIVATPAAGSIPGALLANDAVGLFENVAAVNVADTEGPTKEVLAADATNDRLCLIMGIATVTAAGGPDIDVGSAVTAINAAFDDISGGTWVVGERWIGACMLPAGEALNATIGAGTGGAIDFYVIPITVVGGGAAAGFDDLFVGGTNYDYAFNTGVANLLAANAPGEGDRLLVVQAEVTTAWAGTSYDVDVGSTAAPSGLFLNIFGGTVPLAVGASVIGTYLLPEGEALVNVENDMVMTAGVIRFRILVNTPAAGSIAGNLLADDGVYFPYGIAPTLVAWDGAATTQLLAADALNDRIVLVTAIATETAVGGPQYDVGAGAGVEVFSDLAVGAWVIGERWQGSMVLPKGSALNCTNTVGGASAGDINFYVQVLTPNDAAIHGLLLADDAIGLFEDITPTTVPFDGGALQEILALDATDNRHVLVMAIATVAAESGVCEWDVGAGGGNEVFDDIGGNGTWNAGDRWMGACDLAAGDALNVTLTAAGSQGSINFYVIALTPLVAAGNIEADAVTDAKIASSIVKDEGALAMGVLRIVGVTVNADTVTIGADIYEVDEITAASGDTCKNGEWNNITDPVVIDMNSTDYGTIGVGGTLPLVIGELVYIGTEYMRVYAIGVGGADNVTFERGACGSAIAAHIDTSAINISNAGTPAPTNIPVGNQGGGDLAAATATVNLVGAINETNIPTEDVSASDVEADGSVLFLVADAVGAVTLATTEVYTNGTWDDANMRRGAAAAVRQVYTAVIDIDTEEDTADLLYVPLPFMPVAVHITVLAAGGTPVLWNGAFAINAAAGSMPAYIVLDNTGAQNWVNTEFITILAIS